MHNQYPIELIKIGVASFRNYCSRRLHCYSGKAFYKPVNVIIDITNKCNLRCRHCSVWSDSQKTTNMSEHQVKMLLSDLEDWLGTFKFGFCGGEPLLRNDLIDIIQFACRKGIITGVISNGVLLDEKWAEQLLSSGISSVTISLDGITPQTHDFVRGTPGTFAQATAAVKHLKDLRKKYNSKTRITINTVILESNLDELVDILNWVETNDLDDIWFAPLGQNFGASVGNADWSKENDLWVKRLDKLDQVLDELIRRKKNGSPINNTISHLNSLRHYFRPNCSVKPPTCEAGITTIGISANGDMVLCPYMEALGNVMNSDLKEMWNSDKAVRIRNQIRTCEKACYVRYGFYQKPLIEQIRRFSRMIKESRT